MEGFEVKRFLDAIPEADIVVTTTGNKDIVTEVAFRKLKDKAVVCNIGHFDNEIDLVVICRDNFCACVSFAPHQASFLNSRARPGYTDLDAIVLGLMPL